MALSRGKKHSELVKKGMRRSEKVNRGEFEPGEIERHKAYWDQLDEEERKKAEDKAKLKEAWDQLNRKSPKL
jgi:hypothetical protein